MDCKVILIQKHAGAKATSFSLRSSSFDVVFLQGFVNAKKIYANYEIFVIDSDHVWQSGAWLQILFSDFMKTF